MGVTASWVSRGGVRIHFHILRFADDWQHTAGVYMFCRPEFDRTWTPVYIGHCDSFRDHLRDHARAEEAQLLGASSVLATVIPEGHRRADIAQMLIGELRPQMNVMQQGPSLADYLNGKR